MYGSYVFARGRTRLSLPWFRSLGIALSAVAMLLSPCHSWADLGGDSLREAKLLFARGAFDEALASLAQIKVRFPELAAEAQRMTGVCHQWKKDYSQALVAYDSVLADYPSSEAAAEVYFWIGLCEEAQGNSEAAIHAFSKQASLFPSNKRTPAAILKTGERLQASGDYDAALRQFDYVASTYPDYALRADLLVGICYQNRKMYPAAISALKRGIARSSSGSSLRELKYRLQECFRLGQAYDDGVGLSKDLAVRYPEDAERHYFELGLAYQGKRDFSQAIAVFNDVASRYSDKPCAKDALFRIEECLRAQGKFDEDLIYLQALYEKHPQLREEVLLRKSEVFNEWLLRPAEAVSSLEKLVNEHPNSVFAIEAQARLASVTLYGLKDIPRGKALLRAFVEQHPEYSAMIVVLFDLGCADFLEGRYAEAAPTFLRAVTYSDPGNYRPLCLYKAADCFMRLGNFTKAKESADELIRRFPDDSWAKRAIERYTQLTQGTQTETTNR